MADDGSGIRVEVHLLDCEGIADYVLREAFQTFSLVRLDVLAAVDIEARELPAKKHPGAFGWQ